MGVRLTQLIVGLLLYGFTMALMVQAGLGLDPWDVFHEGLTHHVPLTFGQVVIVVGVIVLLLWIPLRQRPGEVRRQAWAALACWCWAMPPRTISTRAGSSARPSRRVSC